MSYDMNMHVPSQVENLLNGLSSDDERVIDVSIGNIRDLLNDPKFNQSIDDYQKTFEKKVQGIEKTTMDHIKNDGEVKSMDDMIFIINNARNDCTVAYNKFIGDVKTFIILYMGMVKDGE